MSSIYEQLSKSDFKSPAAESEINDIQLPPNPAIIKPVQPPRLKGLKAAVAASLTLAVAALVMSGIFFWNSRQDAKKLAELSQRYTEIHRLALDLKAVSGKTQTELDGFESAFKNLDSRGREIEKEINKSRIEVSNLEKKVMQIEDRSRDIEKKLQAVQNEVIVVAPAEESPLPASVSAAPAPGAAAVEPAAVSEPAVTVPQVMTVNRKFNFVVLNSGLRDQLKMGDRLGIERDGQRIGTVEIEKLYDNFAAATIVEEKEKAPIQEGDLVSRS